MGATSLLLGTRKGTLILGHQHGEWRLLRECHAGVHVSYSFCDPRTKTLWSSLEHGHWGSKLECSQDMGETWEEVSAPKYPEDAVLREGKPATLKYIWNLAPGPRHLPERLYAGTIPGGLFQSDDGGRTFELMRGLWDHPSRPDHWFGGGFDEAGIHSIFVDPRDPQHLVVGISCAGVFESTDHGQTWEARNKGLRGDFLPDPKSDVGHDPHLLVSCAADPQVFWQQNHCGIFRSENGCQSWDDITQPEGPARFGFAIAADQADPLTAWVVPAESDQVRAAVGRALCVCRTEDGGKSWTQLRTGLPQHHCYDLVFRHGLDLQDSKLAFGTSTGKLYISEDRGESWTGTALHLPPIYSVRFVPE